MEFIDSDLNEEETLLYNLVEADRHYDYFMMIVLGKKWVSLSPERDHQKLEQLFRSKGMNTHLIAANAPPIPNTEVTWRDEPKQYECVYSCRPKEKALVELLTHRTSYAENFAYLLNAGYRTVVKEKQTPLNKMELVETLFVVLKKIYYSPNVNGKIKMSYNSVKENCLKLQPNSELKQLYDVPKQKKVVFAFLVDDKVVSRYAFLAKNVKDVKKGDYEVMDVFSGMMLNNDGIDKTK